MPDTPSPLALAREAEAKAEEAYYAAAMAHITGNDDEDGESCHARYKQWRAAQRAHREALVEATLRWAQWNEPTIAFDGSVYLDETPPLSVADVLTAIEENR